MPLNRFPWGDVTFARGRAAAADRRGRPRRQVQPRSARVGTWTLEPAGHGDDRGRVHLRERPADALRPASSSPFGARGWLKRKNAQGAAAAALDPRGGPRPRHARDDRRAARASPPRIPLLNRLRAVSRRLVLTCASRRLAGRRRRLRQQGGRGHPRRDRGHLPRRRRAQVPGADLAPAQPGRHRGPALPRRPEARGPRARAPTRSGSGSSCASRTRPTRRSSPPRSSRSRTRRRPSSTRSSSTSINPSPTGPTPLPPKSLIPRSTRSPPRRTIQGSLLLFKLPGPALDNRPLEFVIKSPHAGGDDGIVDLDV